MEQENETALNQIIDGFKCPRNFRCYEVLCKARGAEGMVSYMECLEDNPEDCVFSTFIQDWDAYVCACPLRAYIAKKLKK
jgi:hypothetical protein